MRDPEYLPVMEEFYTIQGEGHYTGTPAYFIRLGGCDVGCKWCDVKDSWDASQYDWIDVNILVDHARNSGASLVVVTGGEPFMHNLSLLTEKLREANLQCNVETAGVHLPSGSWDWICFSPKKFKKPIHEYYEAAQELKIVLFHRSDFKWAESHALQMNLEAQKYLQPEWSKAKEITPLIVDYVKRNPSWKISLQTHKFIDIP
ncbi:MAG: 7-carboxy-7-deazaguanine synthase QueE [Bacteroidota bacterium]